MHYNLIQLLDEECDEVQLTHLANCSLIINESHNKDEK
jgi:hypothetical protein